jgi:hypothetical protein
MEKLQIIRGDSADIDVVFEDSSGVAIDLTNKSVFFTVKDQGELNTDNDDNAKISKKITSHTDPTAGKTKITLTPTDTDLTPKDYVYDLQLVNGENNVISTQRDYLDIIQDVTKRIE